MKKLMSLMVLLLLSITTLTKAQTTPPIVVDFYWASMVEGDLPAIFQAYADDFMAQNPGIVVNIVYKGSYNQTRDAVFAEGDTPTVDVAILLATDLFTLIADSHIIPLSPMIDAMGAEGALWVEDFFPAFWENSVDGDGVIWGVPFQRSTPILFYNADLLRENGLEVPTNNEALITVAQALTTPERYGLLLPIAGTFPIWIYQSFASGFGQSVVDDNPAHVYFDTPASVQAVTFMTRVGLPIEEGGFGIGPKGGGAWGETPQAFVAGQAAMIYHTTGSLTSILDQVAQLENPFEVGVAFLPSGPAGEDGTGYATPTGGGNLYLVDSAVNPKPEAERDAAWRWVMFLSSPEIQADWGAKTGYIASRHSAWQLEPLVSLVQAYPQYAVARDQLAFATKEFATYRTVEIQAIINRQLSRILSGEIVLDDVASALSEAQAQIDALLAPFKMN